METVLKVLKQEGLELADNRSIGMGINIVSQQNLKYVSVAKRQDKFYISIVGRIFLVSQSKELISELTKVTFLIKTINDAIDKGL